MIRHRGVHRRVAFLLFLVGTSAGIAATARAREPLTIEPDPPKTYREAHEILYGDDEGGIQDYLRKATCGGYTDTSAADSVPKVDGLPGRPGKWDGALWSGMGTREDTNGNKNEDDDYVFPDATDGLSLARFDKSKECAAIYEKLKGDERTPGCTSPDDCGQKCREANEVTYDVSLTVKECVHEIKDEEGNIKEERYDSSDEAYYEKRGEQGSFNCRTCISGDKEGGQRQESVGKKYHCTGDPDEAASGILSVPYGWVWGDKDQSAIRLSAACKRFWVREEMEYPNCTSCGYKWPPGEAREETPGLECRCGSGDPGGKSGCRSTQRMSPLNGAHYESFARSYKGTYTRDATVITTDPPEVTSQPAEVYCYGFYEEFDPRKRRTDVHDQRCILDIDVSELDVQTRPEQRIVQRGPDPGDRDQQREHPSGDFDQLKDPFFFSLGGAFSLMNYNALKNGWIPTILSVDQARLTATKQNENSSYAKSGIGRAFDHTGTGRTIVRWWQRQQTLAQKIFRPPVVHVLLPDISRSIETGSGVIGIPDRRSSSIDVQIGAETSLLDAVVDGLQQMFRMSLYEEPIPVVVPLGSPVEYRALAEKWCLWWMQRNGTTSCDSAPESVRSLISRFDEYADHIDDVRMLRAQLVRHLAAVLALQQDIFSPILAWMTSIASNMQTLAAQQSIMYSLLPLLQEVTKEQQTFTEDILFPWCKNDRFTTPVYSLLDPWLPGRAADGSVREQTLKGGLPSLPESILPTDLVLDLSELELPSQGLTVPVLKPIQVRLALENYEPPSIDESNPDIPSPPPSLPSVAPIVAAMSEAAASLTRPTVSVVNPPAVPTFPVPLNELYRQRTEVALQEILETLKKRSEAYRKFWESIGPLPDDSGKDNEEDKKAHKCEERGEKACLHVEMDLLERLQLIGAPPGVLRPEDRESWSIGRISPGGCLPEDDACDILHPENVPARTGWRVLRPSEFYQSTVWDTLRTRVRAPFLPKPLGDLSTQDSLPFAPQSSDLPPALVLPEKIILSPASSSSSNSL
ncbi:MAG: putative reductive dehalogenase subunit A [Candidatus Peregrinibacteria bacterium Gr01-1014_25]|nr:MAG: putative reductive dehalogenase subunit A [Candidatus Peregrinibacteria bacterium Gr01-1014_25]